MAKKVDGGSSPLARGLRSAALSAVCTRGIIPARAGFTVRLIGDRRGAGDHPRSRGVYPPGPISMSQQVGSSPLARGLLGVYEFVDYLCRIIPARAGFTLLCAPCSVLGADHPRSRGVYLRCWRAG